MNIYIFYIKPSKEFNDNPCTLYAYTNKKHLCEQFREQRNMDRFIFRKVKMSNDEYKSFSNNYDKYELRHCQFYTKSEVFGKKIPVQVLCTWKEEETVLVNSDRLWNEYSKYLFDSKCFKTEYLVALETLSFMKLYKFYYNGPAECDICYDPFYSSYGPSSSFVQVVLEEQVQYDDLKLFLRYFQDTFK